MQPTTRPIVRTATADIDREDFWTELQRIATKGVEQPETLTRSEIRHVCRVTLVGMMARIAKQDG